MTYDPGKVKCLQLFPQFLLFNGHKLKVALLLTFLTFHFIKVNNFIHVINLLLSSQKHDL